MRMREGEIISGGALASRRSGWWSRPLLAVAALLLVCAAVYGPGLGIGGGGGWGGIPVIDRDEARFAQASRQMLESGDWVIPRVQDRPRLNKPPLIYWLQASSVWVMTGGRVERDAIWMYRLPSVLCAAGTVLLVWRFVRRVSGASVAFLAASMLAVAPLIAFDAHQARADQLLLFCTTWAMTALWPCWRACRAGGSAPLGVALLFWLGVAAGIMAKGPITPLVALLAVLALSWYGGGARWVLGLRPVLGLAVVSAAVAPWVWAVASRFGFLEYLTLVWNESAGRAAGSSEGHIGPPGMHLVLLIALFWPGSLTTASAVIQAVRDGWPREGTAGGRSWLSRAWGAASRRRIGSPADAFLLAWAVPGWVFFELFGAKLAHYPMPLYPAVAVLSARGAAKLTARGKRPGTLEFTVWAGVGVVLALGGAGLAVLRMLDGWTGLGAMAAAGSVLAVRLVLGARGGTYEKLLRRGRWAAALACFAVFTCGGPVIPGDASGRIMAAVRLVPGWETRPIASSHRQDSMVFQTRGRVERLEEGEIAAWLERHPDGLAVVSRRAARDRPDWRTLGLAAPSWFEKDPWAVVELSPNRGER